MLRTSPLSLLGLVVTLGCGSESKPKPEPEPAEERIEPVLNTSCQLGAGYLAASLSATGCYVDPATREVVPAMVPYDVNSELWVDGTSKRRFLSVSGGTLGVRPDRAWKLPDGAVLMKEFWLQLDPADPASRRPIETRFLIHRDGTTLEGLSYMWNEAGTDGTLLTTSVRQPYTLTDSTVHDHYFPSRSDCATCHSDAAGRTLGLRTAQLNRDGTFGTETRNQLTWLWEHGYLDLDPGAPDAAPRMHALADSSASLELRARSYLAANCAHCHLPGGPTLASVDLRFETSFKDTRTCYAYPSRDLGVTGASIIKPGSAAQSVLHLRMTRRGAEQMPPLGTFLVDEAGAAVVGDWINALTGCP